MPVTIQVTSIDILLIALAWKLDHWWPIVVGIVLVLIAAIPDSWLLPKPRRFRAR